MEPHVERLNELQEGSQRLPSLIQAAMAKERTKRTAQSGSYKCVDRLLSDIENLEDRIEALNEIMEAQRQRVLTEQYFLWSIRLFFFSLAQQKWS